MAIKCNSYNPLLYKKEQAELNQVQYTLQGLTALLPTLTETIEINTCEYLIKTHNVQERQLKERIQQWEQEQSQKTLQKTLIEQAHKMMTTTV